jgi:hypothetical protein
MQSGLFTFLITEVVWATFSRGKSCVLILAKKWVGLCTLRTIFSQTYLVTQDVVTEMLCSSRCIKQHH